ncbi:MAG: DNA repair exonuclease [bacterium]|nr:DNA repair exonuclease [bacterium]MDE0601807.1 DNA repair exonuclease [bacterium]
MVTVRFLHTADWQLGMTRYFLEGEAQARFTQARIDVIRRIASLAVQEKCSFVVVSGDVFESNHVARPVIVRALEAMAETPQVPFYLLPGNHDPLDASSVYKSRTFTEHRPENVVVLEGSEALFVDLGVELIAAPWTSKRPLHDLVGSACEGLVPTDAVRVVVGHGPLDLPFQVGTDPRRISLSALENNVDSKLIQYVALGDRHSKSEEGRTGRIWYSGAPEPTDFDEIDPGHVLIVTLTREHIDVDERLVGTWRFIQKRWELAGNADLDGLGEWLADLPDKECTVIRMDVVGQVSLAQNARLGELLSHHSDLLAVLDGRTDNLVVVPDDLDIEHFGLSGFAERALHDLLEMASTGGSAAAGDALSLLYRLVRHNP